MWTGKVSAIAGFLPDAILSNEALAELYPGWDADKIYNKTGIRERRIAAEDQTAGDLAEGAARRLFETHGVDPRSIDFLLLCTQAPDHVLPTTACILHARLGLRPGCGALDFNLGCSGFVYGLSLANGLIASGAARRVLLLTADTYSKFIHPMDKSVRTLFGDGAAATLIEAEHVERAAMGPFVFGTDGAGASKLIVPAGGARRPRNAASAEESVDLSGNVRTSDNLFMDGAEVLAFTLSTVPQAVEQLLEAASAELDDFDLFVFHQANAFMLERLRRKLGIASDRFVVDMALRGNTVSSTIPLALEPLMGSGGPRREAMLVGFGVGYSWAATRLTL